MDAYLKLQALLAQRQRGYSLPQAMYGDQSVFDFEMAELFHREWLFAGHSCEIPKTGDYLTHRVGNAEAIILRDAEGGIRAYHNSCRHRGSRLCQAERGTAPRLVCPYHQWTYDLEGRLLFAREMGDGFDPAAHALKPVRCEELAGYIFISFAQDASDFGAFRAVAEPYIVPHALRDAKLAHVSSSVEDGNWKLVWENNRECYHCSGSHPELCRTFSDAPTITGVERQDADDWLKSHWQRCEAAGLPSLFRMADTNQYRLMRVPLNRDTESFTMSGKPAVAKPLGGISERRIGSMLMFYYPTTWNHLLGDHATTFQVTPIGPQQTRVTTKWLVHKDAVEGVDYDLSTLTEVWTATNDQDRRLVEQNQLGVNAPGYEPGPYSTVYEDGVIQFVDWYCDLLADRVAQAGHLAAAE